MDKSCLRDKTPEVQGSERSGEVNMGRSRDNRVPRRGMKALAYPSLPSGCSSVFFILFFHNKAVNTSKLSSVSHSTKLTEP